MLVKWMRVGARFCGAALKYDTKNFPLIFLLPTVFITILFWSFISLPLEAQENPEAEEPTLSAPETPAEIKEENGSSQIVITAEDIAALKVNKIEDVLNQAPGVSASSSSVTIHGSAKVRVLLDGTPLNDPTSSYGAINLDHISLNSVEKIVILKDAGSLTYGQGATGGVVLIQTKNFNQNLNTGQIRLWSGNNDTYHGDADVMLSRGPWGFGFKGGYERTQSYKINNDSERMRGGARVSRNFGENKNVSLSVDYLREEGGYSGLPNFPTPHSRHKSTNLTVTQATQWANVVNNLYYNRGNARTKDWTRSLNQSLTVTEYGDSLSYDRALWLGQLSIGGGFKGTIADSSEFGSHKESVVHLFLSQSLTLPFFPLTLKAGARYNINSAFENTINPELTLSYRHSKFETIYKISRGVNLPSLQMRYNRSSSTDPNPNLGIEKATNQSFSVNFFPLDGFSVNATVFLNKLRGRISYVRPLNSGIGHYENLGTTVYKGLDLGFSWRIIKPLELKASYIYLDARDKDIDKFLTSIPRNSLIVEVSLKPVDTFSLTLKADYDSVSYSDRMNTSTIASRILYSLRAEKSFGKYVLFLDGVNILDKEYYYVDGLLAPARAYFAGIKYNF
jgi:iron complex outermembrane receptor protein